MRGGEDSVLVAAQVARIITNKRSGKIDPNALKRSARIGGEREKERRYSYRP